MGASVCFLCMLLVNNNDPFRCCKFLKQSLLFILK